MILNRFGRIRTQSISGYQQFEIRTDNKKKIMKTTRWEVGGVVKEMGRRNELTTRREKESDERENKA